MRSRREFLKSVPAGVAGVALARPFVRASAEVAPITLAYPADVITWDVIAGTSLLGNSLSNCVFDRPTAVAPDLSIGPSVVARSHYLDSKTLELTLRDDVTFQNGDKFSADDIKFSFEDRPRQDPTLQMKGTWTMLDSVEVKSPTSVVFHFNIPFVTGPQLLGDSASFIMPRKYFERVGKDEFVKKPIGSGPYRLVDYERDSRLVFEAYEGYWRGPAKIKRVTVQIIKDPSARVAAIQAGQVDFAHNMPVREVLRLGQLPELTGVLHPISNVVLFHMVNKGVFRDKNLRLAMHHAIDKQALSRAFFNGQAAPLSMWAGPGMPANDPNYKFEYSQATAKALLAQSGYGPDKPAKIPFLTLSGVFANDFDIARALVQMWKQVGIDADLQTIDANKYAEMARNDKLEAPVLYSWYNATGDPSIYGGTILDPGRRFSVWKSDDIPPRLDPLLSEVDYDKRMKGYIAFDEWTVEQGYAFPLLQGVATVVHKKSIGYAPSRTGWVLPYFWTVG